MIKIDKSTFSVAVVIAAVLFSSGQSQIQAVTTPASDLPVKYEELTTPEFIQAVKKSESTCLIPLGILEKHGPHLPLGTDLLDCREVSLRAARKEYTIVFPAYYVGQIFEAKHQPGTIAYSADLMLKVLQETCDELSRNGVKKIILVNGHGGNECFLRFFCQCQLAIKKDYAVYLFDPPWDTVMDEKLKGMLKTELDGHAGETETSTIMAHRPDLAHTERAGWQSGEDLKRLAELKYAYTGIWWYASHPHHYRGDGSFGNKELGEAILNHEADLLAEMIRSVKKDTVTLELQKKFYEGSIKPLSTKQD